MFKSKKTLAHVKDMCTKKQAYNNDNIIKSVFNSYHEYLQDRELLKYGNGKLSKNIARIDLPEVVTCCSDCQGCYAKKQLFISTVKYRLRNLFIIDSVINNNIIKQLFYNKINKELSKHVEKCKKTNQTSCMRWHASGDIYCIDYLYVMFDIARDNKEILFYTYTKNFKVWLEYKKLKSMGLVPDNFNIVSSIIYNHVNFFDFKSNFISELNNFINILNKARHDNIKIYFCNYASDKLKLEHWIILQAVMDCYPDVVTYSKDIDHCGQCLACTEYEHVLFIKH